MKDARLRLRLLLATIIVVVLGLGLRFYRIRLPFVGYHSWRQCNTAGIARNMYRGELNPCAPHVDWNGRETGPVGTEFQLVTFLVGAGYRLFGFHERIARYVSISFFVLSLAPLGYLARRVGGTLAVVFAVFLYVVSPMGVALSRSIQPEMANLCLALWSLALFWHYLDGGSRAAAVGAAVTLALAIAVKLPALYLGFPFLALLLAHRGLTGTLRMDTVLIALGGLIPGVGWYVYAATFPVPLGFWSAVESDSGRLAVWTSYHFWEGMVRHTVFLLTGPGAVLSLAAFVWCVYALRGVPRALVVGWAAGVAAFELFAGNIAVIHSYYLYPALPVASIAAGSAMARLLERSWPHGGMRRLGAVILAAGIVVAVSVTAWREIVQHAYSIPEAGRRYLEAARLVQRVTRPDDLVVTSAIQSRPEVLYYADRRGWGIPFRRATRAKLQDLVNKGARWYAFIVPHLEYGAASDTDERMCGFGVDAVRAIADVNCCAGLGTGYNVILPIAPWLSSLRDGETFAQWVHREVMDLVTTGHGLDEKAERFRLDAFVIPYPRNTTEYQLLPVLLAHPRWHLVFFDDVCCAFIHDTAVSQDTLARQVYATIDPTNAPHYWPRRPLTTPAARARTLDEAMRALKEAPSSRRCFAALVARLTSAGRFDDALALCRGPSYVKNWPRFTRHLALSVARSAGRTDTIGVIARELLERWPDDEQARQALAR